MNDAEKITQFLQGKILSKGLGTVVSPCSIAAVNLALSGRLTDDVPECMSEVIGSAIIALQDAIPDELRNGNEWRTLLPLAAGTGRQHEAQRLAVIMDWMWRDVLPLLQPVADEHGFGAQWAAMCEEKTESSANGAARAAWVSAAEARSVRARAPEEEAAAWEAAVRARAAAEAAEAAHAAHAACAAAVRARAAAEAAWAAEAAVAARADQNFWATIDVPGLVRRMIQVGQSGISERNSGNERHPLLPAL